MEIRYSEAASNHPFREIDVCGTASEWRILAGNERSHNANVKCQQGADPSPYQKFLSAIRIEIEADRKLTFTLGDENSLLIIGGSSN